MYPSAGINAAAVAAAAAARHPVSNLFFSNFISLYPSYFVDFLNFSLFIAFHVIEISQME